MLYEQSNKIYRGKNLTVKGGDKRSYVIDKLDPYKAYTIEIQAFTRAGVSPKGKAKEEVVTHEDGKFTGLGNHLHCDTFSDQLFDLDNDQPKPVRDLDGISFLCYRNWLDSCSVCTISNARKSFMQHFCLFFYS